VGISASDYRRLLGNLGTEPPRKPRTMYRSKTEMEYADFLEDQRMAGKIRAWWYEAVTFRLAKGVRYCPDFLVQVPALLGRWDYEYHEVKGRKGSGFYSRPMGKAKARIAAALFPFRFCFVWPNGKEGWERMEIAGGGK
jgi:hypothetical protein